MSMILQTILAADARLAERHLLHEERHWTKPSLWYTTQEHEDIEFPKQKDEI
jgi:hypothetical protein